MANLFKRVFSKNDEEVKTNKEEEAIGVKEDNNDGKLKLELSLGEEKEARTSKVVRDMHMDELESFPEVKEGDINISSSYLYDNGENIEVNLYVRNAFKTPIKFEFLPLMILNSKNEILARQVFDARDLGEIPSMSARPWKIFFEKANVLIDKISTEDYKVVFDSASMRVKNPLENFHFEDFPSQMENHEKEMLNGFLSDLGQLKENEVNVTGFSLERIEEKIESCIVIRNGSKKRIRVEKLPLAVLDANSQEAAKKVFEFDDLYINPKCAKAVFVVFDEECILNNEADLSTWSIVGAR